VPHHTCLRFHTSVAPPVAIGFHVSCSSPTSSVLLRCFFSCGTGAIVEHVTTALELLSAPKEAFSMVWTRQLGSQSAQSPSTDFCVSVWRFIRKPLVAPADT
jgi:hypothetical protein